MKKLIPEKRVSIMTCAPLNIVLKNASYQDGLSTRRIKS